LRRSPSQGDITAYAENGNKGLLRPVYIASLGPVIILLVEDHTDTRMVLTSLLGRSGYRIMTTNKVQEAFELLGQIRFDILLSDLGLPDGDGLDVVRRAKELQPHIRAVALTARGTDKDFELGRAAGFDYYLTKPFDLQQLRRALQIQRRDDQAA
jgi:CheY-like chemotaxis protein